ncbi:MAG: tetratricopeptide repeat protein [Chitinophagaceae bacterium]|nr:tetratricopeptide repeat protein [Chitinophagaceae bacterium]
MTDTSYTLHSPQCPQPPQWLRYRRGLSSAEETRAIEEHFTNCPLCNVAIEHIMSTPANELEQAWFHLPPAPTIHPTKAQPFQLKRYLTPISIAASFILFVGGAYFLYQKTTQENRKPLAQLSEVTKPATPLSPNQEIPNQAVPIIKNTPSATFKKQEETPPLAVAPVKPSKNIPVESIANTAADRSMNEADIAYKAEPMANAAPAMAFNANEMPAPAMEEKRTENVVATAKPLAQARNMAVNDNMKIASDKNTAVKGLAENNTPTGIDYYQQHQFHEAIPLLEKAIKANPQNEELHWFLGDALAKIGRTNQAKKHLRIVAQGNSPYKKQAQHLLDLLK